MMNLFKPVLICWIVFLNAPFSQAQSLITSSQFNSSSGHSGVDQILVDWTLGEWITAEYYSDQYLEIGFLHNESLAHQTTSFASENPGLKKITVWPNPTSDFFHLVGEYSGISFLELYDHSGRFIQKWTLNRQALYQLQNIPRGNYGLVGRAKNKVIHLGVLTIIS